MMIFDIMWIDLQIFPDAFFKAFPDYSNYKSLRNNLKISPLSLRVEHSL